MLDPDDDLEQVAKKVAAALDDADIEGDERIEVVALILLGDGATPKKLSDLIDCIAIVLRGVQA